MIVNDMAVFRFFDKMANGVEIELEFYDPYARPQNGTLLFDISSVIDISQHYQNLMLVYDSTTAKEQILLVDNLQKIFRKYFQINGIERLIATNYSDIEWSMFFEFDFIKGQPKYYRDHFVHQFRDAYLSLQLLNECKLYKNIEEIFKDDATVIAKYINNMIEKQKKVDIEELPIEVYYGEIIFKATLLAAIFHDLGYPLSYFARVSNQIQNSLPFYKVVSFTGTTDFLNIRALLADSLLFRTVKDNVIRDKYEKSDHGAMSAICFLLNFYYTGGVSDLSPIDRCIIELAARSIYDHTNKYENGHRMTLYENPISYLLRISDDLQEWSRFTFSVGQNSNAMVCQDTFDTICTKNGLNYNSTSEKLRFIKTTGTDYKKLNYISACSQIQLDFDGEISIKLNYEPYRMLELSALNFFYAVYRVSELRQLKKMLPNQKGLPVFSISYNLSNNVFYLANEIMELFLEKKKNFQLEKALDKVRKDKTIDELQKLSYEEILTKSESKEFLEALKRLCGGLNGKDIKTYIYYLSDMDEKFKEVLPEEHLKRLTTNEYSDYLVASEEFLAGNLGFLGLLNLLISYIN